MEIYATSTKFDGINISYLASLSETELKEILKYLANGEIDAESFVKPQILNTKSLNEDEKMHWLNLIPSMTGAQIERLMIILITEYNQLIDLSLKYEKEIKSLVKLNDSNN